MPHVDARSIGWSIIRLEERSLKERLHRIRTILRKDYARSDDSKVVEALTTARESWQEVDFSCEYALL